MQRNDQPKNKSLQYKRKPFVQIYFARKVSLSKLYKSTHANGSVNAR